MTPDVNALVMDHEETSEDLPWSVEIDSIAVGDVIVVFHEGGCSMDIADVVSILSSFVFFLFFAV